MVEKSSSIAYRADIDGLRAICCIFVVLTHGLYVLSGNAAVDIFLVISGYLITSILLREYQKTGTISIKAFYERRVKRIFPVLYIAVGCFLLMTFVFFRQYIRVKAENSICSILMSQNLCRVANALKEIP